MGQRVPAEWAKCLPVVCLNLKEKPRNPPGILAGPTLSLTVMLQPGMNLSGVGTGAEGGWLSWTDQNWLEQCQGPQGLYLEGVVGALGLGVCLHLEGLHKVQGDSEPLLQVDAVGATGELGVWLWEGRAAELSGAVADHQAWA